MWQKTLLLIITFTILLLLSTAVEAKTLNLTFCCAPDNDLYAVLTELGHPCPRFDNAAKAVEKAPEGSSVMILADGYPQSTTKLDAALFEQATTKKLTLYVEYPEAIPGLEVGAPQHTEWERGVVSSEVFGESLQKLRILAIHDCHFVPVKAENPLLVVARVAGFDTAVFGLPQNMSPVLFELPERNLIISTTKLSQFVTARYAPTEAWKTIWEHILLKLGIRVELSWQPAVHPAYGPTDRLPKDVELRALKAMAHWFLNSRLLIPESRKEEIHNALRANVELALTPGESEGDGSLGILEGYSSTIRFDGSQMQRLPIRSDCHAEAALVLALDSMINRNPKSGKVAENLLDFVFFNSGICQGPRGNPRHPAFGHVAWGDISPAWLVANYGDDDARVILGTMGAAACLDTDKWSVPLMRALLANLRTTGPQGFRGDRIDIPVLEAHGWKYFEDTPRVNYAPHFESYLWACYLWAYRQTGYKPFLDKTKTAIRMTMEAYPEQWRWGDSVERSRMLLCLAWLVRIEDTPRHREWLLKVAGDLLASQDSCGALREQLNASGGGGHYFAPQSNEAYGTGETPLIQQNGDPASDQLYTTGFALLGLHEAFAATGEPGLKKAEDKLADYLCRIQVRAPGIPILDGCWFRAFDYKRWEYWASSGDVGWGAWSTEAGWAQAWTAAVLGLRTRNLSFWDLTAKVNIARHFREVKQEMAQTPEGAFGKQ